MNKTVKNQNSVFLNIFNEKKNVLNVWSKIVIYMILFK